MLRESRKLLILPRSYERVTKMQYLGHVQKNENENAFEREG